MKIKDFALMGRAVVFVVVLFLVASCRPASPSVVVVSSPDSVAIEVNRDNLPDNLLEIFYTPRVNEVGKQAVLDPYLSDELILVGSNDQLETLIKSLESSNNFKAIDEENANSGIRVIDTQGTPVDEAKNIIESKIAALTESGQITDSINVGKNYLVGSPWDVEAGPWDVEAGSFQSSTVLEDVDIPWDQWAFREEFGINLYNEFGVRQTTIEGANVRVFIYDTSPLDEQEPKIGEAFPNNIKVSFADNVLPDVDSDDSRYANTDEHGLFVAGLVHFIAPQAQIELVEILNNQGVGDLATLMGELNKLLSETDPNNNEPDLNDVVINLSLGLHPEPIGAEPDLDFFGDRAIERFRIQLQDLQREGAVIVAAAGNHSLIFEEGNSYEGIMVEPLRVIEGEVSQRNSTYPARWPTVISVSGYGGETYNRSCFSNEVPVSEFGELFSFRAPSGNGYQQEPERRTDDGIAIIDACQSPLPACEDLLADGGYSCPYTVVSTTTNGYRHWSGTSFGTPIVSGVAALVIDKCNDDDDFPFTSGGLMEFIQVKYKSVLDAPGRDFDPIFDQHEGKFDVAHLLSNGTGCPQK